MPESQPNVPSPVSVPAPAASKPRTVSVVAASTRLILLALLAFLTLVGLALTLASFAARQWWVADLVTNFRVQIGLWLGLCGLLLAAARSNGLAMAALVGGAFNMMFVVPSYVPVVGNNPSNARPLRVLLLNVGAANTDHAAVLSEVIKEQPDVAMLLETTPAWVAAVAPLKSDYTQEIAVPRDDSFGMAIYSRLPLAATMTQTLGSESLPVIQAVVQVGTASVQVIAAHPPPPLTARYAKERNLYLHDLTSFVRSQGTPAVLCGDLNATPWSPYFGDLAEGTGMRDASRGYGLQPSWNAFFPRALLVPVDHCLVSPEVGVRGVRRGPKVGSDHLPLIVDLAVPGK